MKSWLASNILPQIKHFLVLIFLISCTSAFELNQYFLGPNVTYYNGGHSQFYQFVSSHKKFAYAKQMNTCDIYHNSNKLSSQTRKVFENCSAHSFQGEIDDVLALKYSVYFLMDLSYDSYLNIYVTHNSIVSGDCLFRSDERWECLPLGDLAMVRCLNTSLADDIPVRQFGSCLRGGPIVGIVFGSALGFFALFFLILCYGRRRRTFTRRERTASIFGEEEEGL